MYVHLRFPTDIFNELRALCESAAPLEQGCFALVGATETGRGLNLAVSLLLPPGPGAWTLQETARLSPSTTWMSEVLGIADENALGLAFIHSHPGDLGGPWFSAADEWMHEALVPVMTSNLPGRPFASLVLHRGRLEGSVWFAGERHRITRVHEVGGRLLERGGEPVAEHEGADFARQVQVWGCSNQSRLTNLHVGIVGAGGTGSAVAEQLTRLGVGKLTLVDPDILEASNVARVFGSSIEDVGRTKAETVAGALSAIRRVEVRALAQPVQEEAVVRSLLDCDLLFGCTDDHASRSTLNDIAVQHLIPLVDVGCKVGERNRRVDGVPCEVRLVHPAGPCLWCMGAIDADRVATDLLPRTKQEALRDEGYVQGLGDEPSVIFVTATAASLAVMMGLNVILGILDDWPRERFILDLHRLDVLEPTSQIDVTCVCRARRGVGSKLPIGWAH